MSAEDIRRTVAEMAEAAKRAGLPPDDEFSHVIRCVEAVGRQIADAAEEIKASNQRTDEIVEEIKRDNRATTFRIRNSINGCHSMIVHVWVACAAASATAMAIGLWIGGYLR